MWPLTASSRVIVAVVILSLASNAVWFGYVQWLKNKHGTELRKMLDAGAEVVKKRELVVDQSNVRIAELERQKGKVRIIYRDAIRSDPECKAWSELPISCPSSWQ